MYVEAYLQSQQQIQLIPTENIAKFIEKDESTVNFDNVLINIESLEKDDNYGYRKADPYWARVLGQTEQFKSQDGLFTIGETNHILVWRNVVLKRIFRSKRSWILIRY